MNNAHYIDTRPTAPGLFANNGIEDYGEWLMARYQAAQEPSGKMVYCYGIAQRLNAIIHDSLTYGVEVFAIGPSAGAAARVVEQISGGKVVVEVLG